jgi:hypothetical protein
MILNTRPSIVLLSPGAATSELAPFALKQNVAKVAGAANFFQRARRLAIMAR